MTPLKPADMKRIMRGASASAVIVACLILVFMASGCSSRTPAAKPSAPAAKTDQKRDTAPRASRDSRDRGVTSSRRPDEGSPLRETGSLDWDPEKDGEQSEKKPEEQKDDAASELIKQAGFDMIYPNFRKDTGRMDPFVPVTMTGGPIDVMKRSNPEKFRVIGTAMTPTGQIAMVEVGELIKIVREGDILENEAVVKKISQYEVLLEKDARQVQLTMFTRKRIATLPEEAMYPELPGLNINDLYKQYLEQKFGTEIEGEEGEKGRPGTFNDYLQAQEKQTSERQD